LFLRDVRIIFANPSDFAVFAVAKIRVVLFAFRLLFFCFHAFFFVFFFSPAKVALAI
jgi:hypothetical protein